MKSTVKSTVKTTTPRQGSRLFQGLLAVVVLAGGGFMAKKLVASRQPAKRKPAVSRGALVDVFIASASSQKAIITAQGTVIPAQQVTLQPQVQGAITEINPQLVPGGRVQAGDALLEIDASDYRLAVEQQQANLARAEFELEVERGRKLVADREWKLLKKRGGAKGSGTLARREPHIKVAKATVRGAKSALRRARLDVNRTRLSAPFNAIVEAESVEVGQVIRPGVAVATLVGTDAFWVQTSVPMDELGWMQLPDAQGKGGAKAHVVYRHEGKEVRREGRVVRLLGRLDPVGRMARLMVQVERPLEGSPLLLGAFVSVEIEGRGLDAVYEVPRLAVRTDDTLWKVKADNTLVISPVKVIRKRAQTVLVAEGVGEGDKIVTSKLTAPVPGMKLRTPGQRPDSPEANAQTGDAPSDASPKASGSEKTL
ncbi:MAG: efflux RND transporter periplasmic adaptor subunit [Bradymonadia bacterium]